MLFIISCKEYRNQKVIQHLQLSCSIENLEKEILQLPEIKEKNQLIDSITNHKNGISFNSQETEKFYKISVGYNSHMRWENYFDFEISKDDCVLKILDVESGNFMSIENWRSIHNKNKSNVNDVSNKASGKKNELSSENFIQGDNHINKVHLPFSFYSYFKDEYSEEKYPSYEPTDKLVEFLISNDYEGEKYKYFVISSENPCTIFVVSVVRGDAEYFLLLTSSNNTIIDFKEIGAIGNYPPVTFKIYNDYSVEQYEGILENNTVIRKKWKINDKCEIK